MNEQQDLVNIVSRYIILQQGRKALKGRCPFHNDGTTSFMIIPHTNKFKCFGCGAEGGPIDFLLKIEENKNKVISQAADTIMHD